MQPHEQWVVDEKKELDERRVKLDTFIMGSTFLTLPKPDQIDLRAQSQTMQDYSAALRRRIGRFV